MKWGYYIFYIWILTERASVVAICDDPDTKPVPDWDLRYVHNTIDSSHPYLDDAYLQAGWYKICNNRMPETPPDSIWSCGTKFPIWLNDVHPSTVGAIKSVTACVKVTQECAESHQISVVKCSDDCFAYYLVPTTASSRYCFGTGVSGARSTFQPSTPEVILEVNPAESATGMRTTLTCSFTASTNDDDLLYMVHWYKNGIRLYNTPTAKDSSDSSLIMTENIFNEKGFTMGSYVSCRVSSLYTPRGPTSTPSGESTRMFIGIEVPNTYVELTAGIHTSATIPLRIATPISCYSFPETCSIRLVLRTETLENTNECHSISIKEGAHDCGVKIWNTDYNNSKEFNIAIVETGQTGLRPTAEYILLLQVERTLENKIWGYYKLPEIRVNVVHETQSDSSMCSIRNDPHMITIDGRKYDHHPALDDNYVLYKRKDGSAEVQVRYKACNTPNVRCLCGVAARAGFDVYVWDICGATHKLQYTHCSDIDRSLVVTGAHSETDEVKIKFPYGTYVKVTKKYFSWVEGGYFLTANVYPTSSDKDNTLGLCGTYDGNINNDFHKTDGTSMGESYHEDYPDKYNSEPTEFTDYWKVEADHNLFSDEFDIYTLKPLTLETCICEHDGCDSENDNSCIDETIHCKKIGETQCSLGNHAHVLEAHQCKHIPTTRRKRRTEFRRTQARGVPIENTFKEPSKVKREASEQTWTDASAREYCNQQFNLDAGVNLCAQIPAIDTNDDIEVCVQDILLTHTADWVKSSIEDLKIRCKEELWRNVTIANSLAAGSPLFVQINETMCITDCSGRGSCVTGGTGAVCACEDNAGGPDCSINLTAPVYMSGLLNSGLCASDIEDCSKTFAFGGAYVDSDNLLCKLVEFVEDINGVRTYGAAHTTRADYVTYLEIKVHLPSARKRRSITDDAASEFVSGYSISVSNNGETYSDSADYYRYNSECQLVDIDDTITFTLKEGFCLIYSQCHNDGQKHADDECYFCNATSPFTWTFNDSKPGCVAAARMDDTSYPNIPLIVGPIAGVVSIAVIAVAVVIIKQKLCKTTVGVSQQFVSPVHVETNAQTVSSRPESPRLHRGYTDYF